MITLGERLGRWCSRMNLCFPCTSGSKCMVLVDERCAACLLVWPGVLGLYSCLQSHLPIYLHTSVWLVGVFYFSDPLILFPIVRVTLRDYDSVINLPLLWLAFHHCRPCIAFQGQSLAFHQLLSVQAWPLPQDYHYCSLPYHHPQ